jgi:hypothetical protein
MATPTYTVETEDNGWSYIIGSNGYREGPIRYRWEAQEWADEMNATARSYAILVDAAKTV